jgi:hypothetical protein
MTTVGFSTKPALVAAALEAGRAVRDARPRPAVALLLATHSHALDDLAPAAAALGALFGPEVRVAAVTVNGLFRGEARYDAMLAQQRAAAVVALGTAGAAGARVAAALADAPAGGPRAAGRALVEAARAALGPGAALEGGLLFSPGLPRADAAVDPGLVEGLREAAPGVGVSGCGLSGGVDLRGFSEPGLALLDGRLARGGALFLAFEAVGGSARPGRTALAIANGLRPAAAPPLGVITRARDGRVFTIDDRPAFAGLIEAVRRCERGRDAAAAEFEKNLGLALVERGLSFAVEDPAGDFYWPRIPLRALPDGSFFEAFEAEPGEALRLVEADATACLHASRAAAASLRADAPPGGTPFELVLAFSCAIRGFVLGPRAADEGRDLGALAGCPEGSALGIIGNGEFGTYRGGPPRATGWAYSLFGVGAGR